MPIDPGGTAPGLSGAAAEPLKSVNMKCKRPECDSMRVVEVLHPGAAAGRRLYRCIKCHTSWGVLTGGPVDL